MRSVSHKVNHSGLRVAATRPDADELTRFERLLLELAMGFVDPPDDSFDGAIVGALRRIVETLDIDRSTLNLMSTVRGRIEVAYSYAVPGIEPTPRMASGPEHWPWAWSLLSAGQPVVYASLDDLPAEAALDRANWERVGLKSHVTIPLLVNGTLCGGLSFGAIRRQRTWPDALLVQMWRVADLIGHALAHMYAKEELDRALGFERLASRILASIFLERPAADGGFIAQALRDIGQLLRVEWVGLWERSPTHKEFHPAHDWRAPGIGESVISNCATVPWLVERLLACSLVNIGRAPGIAVRPHVDMPKLQDAGARSLLAVPIVIAGEVRGAFVLGSAHEDRAWPDAMLPGVKLIGEALASLDIRLSAERRKVAAEVEAAHWRERLAHLVRVHTAGEMSAALAHEITQPLGAIENYAMAARRRLNDAEPQRVRELLDKVIGQATRAGDVVTRMRGMVQRHELHATEIDIARAVRDCVEMVKMDCDLRNIRIRVQPATGAAIAVADEIHVQQVILNLLRNAMDAVQALPADACREIVIGVGADGEEGIVVEVADRGPGIANADLERVFESFYSTKPNGLGIGLALCRRLLEAHGGTLRAAHNPGGGAVFRMTLPPTQAVH